MEDERKLGKMRLSVIVNTLLSLLSVTTPVLNSYTWGRFHSLHLNQCIGIVGTFISPELQNLPTYSAVVKEVRKSQDLLRPHYKRKIIPGNLEKILEFCHC